HAVAIEEPRCCFFRRHGEKWYGRIGRARVGQPCGGVVASNEDEEKGKLRLLGRGFRGGKAPMPAADEAKQVVEPPFAEAPASPTAAPPPAPKQSWLQRLRAGLSRSSTTIARGVTDIFTKRKLDAASLDDLEDVLIQAGLGLAAASRIRDAVGSGRYERGINPDEVKQILADEVERALEPVARPLMIDPE